MGQSNGVLLKEVAAFGKCPLTEVSLCMQPNIQNLNMCRYINAYIRMPYVCKYIHTYIHTCIHMYIRM